MKIPSRKILLFGLSLIAILLATGSWYLTDRTRTQNGSAMPPAEIIPPSIDFGIVRQGAKVEASARIYTKINPTPGLRRSLDLPAFLSLASLEVNVSQHGPYENKLYCDLALGVDTRYSYKGSKSLRCSIGPCEASLPISIQVIPRKTALPKVLIAETPFNKFSTDDISLFSAFLDIVNSLEIEINYVLVLPEDLSPFDVILLAQDELISIDEAKREKLRTFVESGRRLIVTPNAFYSGTVPKVNKLLDGYGLEIEDKDLGTIAPEKKPIPLPFVVELAKDLGLLSAEKESSRPLQFIESDVLESDYLTEGVHHLKFHRPSPIRVTDPSLAKMLVPSFVAVARGKGEIVVLTQSLWWWWVGHDVKGSDNGRLLRNLLVLPLKKR